MKHSKTFFIICLIAFIKVSASSGLNPAGPSAQNENLVEEGIRKYIKELEGSGTIKLDGEKITRNPVIIKLYEDSDYEPVWTNSNNRNDLIEILEAAYFEGLNPEDYHIEYIREHKQKLEQGVRVSMDDYAIADILMSDAILSYAFHMIQGKVHPTELDPNWNYSEKPRPDDLELRLLDRLESATLKEAAPKLRPEIPMYAEYRNMFALVDSMLKTGGEIQPIEYPGKALRIGDSSAAVRKLKDHMTVYGRVFSDPENEKFDEELDEAIKDFQTFSGLETDGICGKGTYKALNITMEERLDIIRVNMERSRWLNNDLPPEFLLVNIADYNLYIYRDMKVDYECKVVVGKENHETPVFTSNIQYVSFNPTWTVPYSIASKEILPKLKKDPNYLQDRNMTLLKGADVVNPSTVDFKKFNEKNFSYTIRQEPGPYNALGMVKFIFPNKYAVYLHDTPSKSYFEKIDRAFSHGCVRVKDPFLLAEQLLGDLGYDSKVIADVIKSKKTRNVNLSSPMPVMIMYWTCYKNNIDGRMYFFRDVYGRDKKILARLNEKR